MFRFAALTAIAALGAPGQEIGSRACAGCHASIYRKYQTTGMARSAGRAGGELSQGGTVTHGSAEYRVTPAAKGHILEFSRPGEDVSGTRLLEWFVGSGGLGRSYLFQTGGFLFQAPVSYYASAGKWQVSPGYEHKPQIDLTRAVETACLQCHTSRIQPVAGTQNRFASVPFLEGGVSCERCHGPGQAHAARRGAIVNPRKLAAEARDSVCAQCHLTGAARVARAGRTAYRPGNLLSASIAVYVWEDGSGSEATATSHYERLNRSACKRGSGDRLWCGTCHDPHEPATAESYRAKCLGCHSATQKPAACNNGEDCVGCHMPKGESRMVEHVAFTDHGIVRRKEPASAPGGERRLVPFFAAVNARDTALGHAVAAQTEPAVRRTALEQLEAAAVANPGDIPVLAQLAQFYDRLGREEQAMELCERVVKLDPAHAAAAVNLGIYRVKRGDAAGAMALWRSALERNPALTGARVNLAVAQYQAGDLAGAEMSLLEALKYDPDAATPRKLLGEIRAARR